MDPEVRTWMSYAIDDFKQARRNLRAHKDPSYNGAVFHAQQSAEKALKALLVAQQQPVKKVHDLVVLLALLRPAPPELVLMESQLRNLTSGAAESRYPGNLFDKADAKAEFDVGVRVLEIVATALRFPLDLR